MDTQMRQSKMAGINGNGNQQKKIIRFFPWMNIINEKFIRSFPNEYDIETLELLNMNIEKESLKIFLRCRPKRTEYLFELIGHLYGHFCWKNKFNKESSHMTEICEQLLSNLSQLDSYL
ncbi:hypothetical protein CEXT_187851 [Caerostris extrusa]|uniref:Uncharacterized protein n=1 Tax=Caerostris extrusa TaxID=172846 RepID=A0AAV4MM23_CAEEX|nr:hypothetical protein CEXT_187851 [Caerostris extrusa]